MSTEEDGLNPIAAAISSVMDARGISTPQLGRIMGRSQASTAGYRVRGVDSLSLIHEIEQALGVERGEILVMSGHVSAVAPTGVIGALLTDRSIPQWAKDTLVLIYEEAVRGWAHRQESR